MLYMGNVNRLIFWFLIPLTLIFYVVFRIVEWQAYDNDEGRQLIAQQHAVHLSNIDDIDCFVLGGSNAVFSLSAEQLSNESNLTCYNLSLLNEGFSDEAYFDFIRALPIERTEIKVVIYSPIYPLNRASFEERLKHNQNQTDISGKQDFQITGNSVANYLLKFSKGVPLFHLVQHPLPTHTGDFNFDEYGGCKEEIVDIWIPVNIDYEFKNWLVSNLMTIKNLFPNADISFVVPSTLRSQVSDTTFQEFSKLLKSEVVKQSVNYIEQSPFADITVLCDATHHANVEGRSIRTSELLSLLPLTNAQ